ncbi:UNVERIFIED_CONTAM: hypothetical protein HHA_243940 [Hammondia hammondi]|eukprot:XP_008884310.1 hypothetical protein HHA_243940 [Hammondia hammondi]
MKLSAAIVFGSLIGFASATDPVAPVPSDGAVAAGIEETLQQGEEQLKARLGEDAKLLQQLIQSLLGWFSHRFGVQQKELADVATAALQNKNIADEEDLKAALEGLSSNGLDLSSMEGLLQGLQADGL